MAEIRNPQQGTTKTTQPRQREGSGAIEPARRQGELARAGVPSPFSFMRRFMSDLDQLFADFGLGAAATSRLGELGLGGLAWSPQVDLFERDGQLVLQADLPGMRPDDVRIQLEEGTLIISGEKQHAHEHAEGHVHRCERTYGSFMRTIPLPEGIDADAIQASFDNGVLEITAPMPKTQAPKGKTIPIRSKSMKH